MSDSRNTWATFRRRCRLETLATLAVGSLFLNPACGSNKKDAGATSDAGVGGQANGNTGGTHTSADASADLISDVACSNDGDCKSLNLVCDTFIALCVKCTGTACPSSTKSDAGSCLESGGNPCSSIPRFSGAQVLDGQGSEFCNAAPMQLDQDNAAKVIAYNAEAPEQLTARIAVSGNALHAYIEVTDASVQTVNMADPTQAINQVYRGDAVELMFSADDQVTGLTSGDTNTLHVIVPANGPAVFTTASNSNGSSQGAPTALPTSQYVQRQTSTGYAIEMQLPWPGGVAPRSGDSIKFDLLLDSADTNFGGVGDMRDGQLIYHLESVGSTTCQGSSDGTVPFCDDRTWCTTRIE